MSTVLFCPFCRESFEGLDTCPEHELALLPWSSLPRERMPRAFDDERPLPMLSPRLGRGLLAAGALGTLAAGALPLIAWTGQLESSMSLLGLAFRAHTRLWLVPFAALAQLSILLRRRTPASMRAARAASLFLAVVPAVVILWTLVDVRDAAAAESVRTALRTVAAPAAAAYTVWASSLAMLAGALRLGVVEAPVRPDGSDADCD